MSIKLYRPVGEKEYLLIKASQMKSFPPRLDWQPIFYPVLNFEYAAEIASKWNTKDKFSEYIGYVLSFEIPLEYFQTFKTKTVGSSIHQELWVPSEQLNEFNEQIQNTIQVEAIYRGKNNLLPIYARKGDITKMKVDAIVNAANGALMGGGGVDGAIHNAAGPELKIACRKLGGAQTGTTKVTQGFQLDAKYIIHAVAPCWNNDADNEKNNLRSCYASALQQATDLNCKSIAFPAISTGAYRFPFEIASTIALETTKEFLIANPSTIEEVHFVLLNQKLLDRFEKRMLQLL